MKRPCSSIEDDSKFSSTKFSKNPDNTRKLTFQLNDSAKDLETQPADSKFKSHQSTPYPKQKLSFKYKMIENEENSDEIIEKRNPEFLTKITSLNRSFIRWIDIYFNKGYNYDFTPVCNDYIRFINNLKEKYPVETNLSKDSSVQNQVNLLNSTSSPVKIPSYLNSPYMNTPPPNPGDKDYKSTPYPKFLLKGNTAKLENSIESKNSNDKDKKVEFPILNTESISSIANSEANSITKNLFDIKPRATEAINTNLLDTKNQFQFPTIDNKFFSPQNIFNNQQMKTDFTTQTTKSTSNDDDEYVPPKPEVASVNEEAIYSIKCKLFYKKDNSYVEKGIGTLYIKETKEEAGNHQLLIRGENSLATILLNIRLKTSLPILQTKNGLLLTCVPNPPLENNNKNDKAETATFYIKVKTNEIRDELLGNLKKYSS